MIVDLHRNDTFGILCQILGHGTDTGAKLQNTIILGNPRCTDDFLKDMGINQKVLSVFFLEVEAVLL